MSDYTLNVELLRNIPDQLKQLPLWMLWRFEERNGKKTKPPFQVNGKLASPTDPATWSSFEQAVNAFSLSCANGQRYAGIGFVLPPGSGFVGIDIDDIDLSNLDPHTRELLTVAGNSYTEVTPSGKGLHILGRMRQPLPEGNKAKHPAMGGKWLELYDHNRYFTVSGNVFESRTQLEDITEAVLQIHRTYIAKPEPSVSTARASSLPRGNLDQDRLIEKAIETDPSFTALWYGDIGQWPSPSEADLSLCMKLAFWTGKDPVRIDQLFRQSGLYREKWERKDYREGTIRKAIERQAESYSGRSSHGGKSFTRAESIPPGWTTEPDKQSFSDPLPLAREEIAPEPYPVHALGEMLGEAAESIHRIVKVPLAIAAQSVLSASNLITQAKANVVIDGRTIPLSLFLLAIALSGERKSEADRIAMAPIDRWQKRKYARYREEYEGYEEALANWKKGRPKPKPPVPPVVKCEEPTVEGIFKLLKEGLGFTGILSDEGGQLLGGYAMSKDHALATLARLSKAWDGRPLDRIRGGDTLGLLYDRRVNLHLMMQPGVADKLLCHDEARDQGFLNRCLICHPTSMFGNRPYQEIDPGKDPAIGRYWERLTALTEQGFDHGEGGGLMFHALTLAPEAKHLWIRFHDALDGHIATKGVLRPIAGAAAKGAEQALRIAGTLAMFDGAGGIDSERMRSGIELTDFYLSEMLRLHEGATVAKEITEAQKLLDWIQQWTREKGRKVVHLKEMYNFGPYSLRTSKAAKEAVAVLVEHGRLTPHPPVQIDGAQRRNVWLLEEGEA